MQSSIRVLGDGSHVTIKIISGRFGVCAAALNPHPLRLGIASRADINSETLGELALLSGARRPGSSELALQTVAVGVADRRPFHYR